MARRKSLKARLQSARSRISRRRSGGGSRLGTGIKAVGLGAAVGVGAHKIGELVSQKVEAVGNRWWAEPALLAAGSFLLSRKNASLGSALAGAAGYSASLRYGMWSANRAGIPQKSTSTQGYDGGFETGYLQMGGGNTSAFQDTGDVEVTDTGDLYEYAQ